MSLDYWFNVFSENVLDIEKQICVIETKGNVSPKTKEVVQTKISKANKQFSTLGHEIRIIRNIEEKVFWKANIAEMDYRFVDAKLKFGDILNKSELFSSSSAPPRCRHSSSSSSSSSNDDYLGRAEQVHDAIDASLSSIAHLVSDSDEVASLTLIQLNGQKEKISSIHNTVRKIDEKLFVSDALIDKFDTKSKGFKYYAKKISKLSSNFRVSKPFKAKQ